jgi:hypothetical protein
MNWIKIKSEHNTPELSDAQLGSLVRYQLLVAKIGRTPTDKEIRKETSIKTLLSAKEALSNIGVTLDHIESKVIEDRDHVKSKRDAGKERVRSYRDRAKCNALPKPLRNDTDKIREDKIIKEDTKVSVKTDLEIAVDEFIKHRKQLKKPMTDKSISLMLEKLHKLASCEDDKIEILNQSIESGWIGIFELKSNTKGVTNVSRANKEREQRAINCGLNPSEISTFLNS